MTFAKEEFEQIVSKLCSIYQIQEAKNITSLLFEEITGHAQSRIFILNPAVSEKQLDQIEKDVKRLLNHEPIQYVLNKAWFYGREFYVDNSVLIPRPETEELVAWVLQQTQYRELNILDIGTGSGCIPITLACEAPHSHVSAIDISSEAIQVAKSNAQNLSGDVVFYETDILKWEDTKVDFPKWDIIISNPPYVCNSEAELMRKNVIEFEPHSALFVENNDPLLFYDRISDFAVQFLNTSGYLFFEINEVYGKAIADLLSKKGFKSIEIKKDLFQKDRMVKAQLS